MVQTTEVIMTFTKTTSGIGTSLIEEKVFEVTESDMATLFGPPSLDNSDIGKGYGSDWYFVSSTGTVFGIGFRWGIMRTRGDYKTNEKEYTAFILWIKGQLNNSVSYTHLRAHET